MLTCRKQAESTQTIKQNRTHHIQKNSKPLLLPQQRKYTIHLRVLCIKLACYIAKAFKPIYRQYYESYKAKLSSLFFMT